MAKWQFLLTFLATSWFSGISTVGACRSSSEPPSDDTSNTASTTTLPITTNTALLDKSDEENINKGDFDVLSITAATQSSPYRQDAVNFATLAFAFHSSNDEIADYIKLKFDAKNGHGWMVFVGRNFSSYCNIAESNFIALRKRSTGTLVHIIRPLCLELSQNEQKEDVDELRLGDVTMLDSTDSNVDIAVKQDTVNFVMLAFQFESTPFRIARYVKEEFDKKHGGYWGCVVGDKTLTTALTYKSNNFVQLQKNDYNIAVFLPDCAIGGQSSLSNSKETAVASDEASPPSTNNSSSGRADITITAHGASKARHDVRQFAVEQARVSVRTLNTTYQRCRYIRSQLEQRYSGAWFCGAGKAWSARYQYRSSNMIVLVATGPTYTSYIQIFQESCTRARAIQNPSSSVQSLNRYDFEIMQDSDQNFGVGKTQDVINYAKTSISQNNARPGPVCEYIRKKLQNKYGGFWTVAAGEVMAISFRYEKPNYIRIRKDGNFAVLAFMHPRC